MEAHCGEKVFPPRWMEVILEASSRGLMWGRRSSGVSNFLVAAERANDEGSPIF